MNPIISVIVPAYNEEKHIYDCIQSLVNQTFHDIEFIFVDDNSKDSTYDIICQWAEKDSRIIPVKNDGKGVASARNFGLNIARGTYIGFADSDDTVHPQMYELLYRAIKENDVPLVYCNYRIGADIECVSHDYIVEIIDMNELSTGDEIHIEESLFKCVWNKLISRKFIGTAKFEAFTVGEDTRFCVNLLTQNTVRNVAYVPIKLYNYRQNEKSITNTLDDSKIYQWISARFDCYELFKGPYKRYSYFYLEQGFFYMVRFKQKYGISDKVYKKKVRKLFYKYIMLYLKSPYSSITDKLYVLICFFFPKLSKIIYK